MEKNYVTFCSPGTFFSEQRTEEIDSWDMTLAKSMSVDIVERHNSTPYGFYFTKLYRGDGDFDSKEVSSSGMYYLGGEVLTLEDIKSRNNSDDNILISNMECNGWDRVIVNNNSHSFTAPLKDSDVILQM